MFRHSFSSEDSELSESLINPKSAIRVSVSLQRYFKDVRGRCYILVVRNRRVRWLEKRIQKIFALPGNFCLCTNGHLLPSSEPLALLHPEDSIEVIPLLEVRLGMLHKRDSSVLNVNNEQEKHIQNDERVSDSPQMHNVVNHHKINSDEADMRSKSSEEDADTAKLDTNDDIDGGLTINNHNSKCSEDLPRETKNASHTLQQLKRRALALLDAQQSVPDNSEAVAEGPLPRRVRRRVRRRRRVLQPEHGSVPGVEPSPEPETYLEPEMEPDAESYSSIRAGSNSETELLLDSPLVDVAPAEDARSLSEVARNEAACSRRPRVVRSLEVEN